MKQTWILKGLDCPHCSSEIEREVAGLEGVLSSSVNLVKQTLTVEADGVEADALEKQVKTVVRKHEPDVAVLPFSKEKADAFKGKEEADEHQKRSNRLRLMRLIVGAAVYAVGFGLTLADFRPEWLSLCVLILAYIILGADVVWRAVYNIFRGKLFDENFLMALSTVGAFVVGEYPEAVAVMLFYQVGEFFQDLAVKRSRRSISSLMDIRPDAAVVQRGGELMTVSPETVAIGEHIVVRAGERIPLDGIVREGSAMLDTRALTGESVPREIGVGDTVLSGCVNQSGLLHIEVTKAFGDSTASKIIDMVEHASSRKAPSENFITSFARVYTPVVVLAALLLSLVPPLFVGEWAQWIRRGFVFLVISCPCALVISVPLTFFGGIGAASKRGVLVKGGNYLEALGNVQTVVFDKTGTLTKGVFEVGEIVPADGFTEEEVLRFAAQAESLSNHPIARSVMTAYGKTVDDSLLADYEEVAGNGVRVRFDGRLLLAGNEKLMTREAIAFVPHPGIGTKVYVAADGVYVGCLLIADEIKEDSRRAVDGLRALGVKKSVMLTGDTESIAAGVAKELGLDAYRAELLPDQKVGQVEALEREIGKKGKLMFVGDGINDAPVLARADIGVAMGGIGSDAAIEAADVVLMTDEPSKLIDAVAVARATARIVRQNIVFSLGVKGVFLVLGAFGIAGMWEAVFGDVGVMVLAVLNAMRILKK
ncbi:MAG: heavy metal translocating P-type ATPase [Acutalibacteraceae bacterium]